MIGLLNRTIGSESKQVLKLQSTGISRPMTIRQAWNQIRIGLHLGISIGDHFAKIVSTPKLSFGVCANGGYEIYEQDNVTHMVGYSMNEPTFFPAVSGSDYYFALGGGGIVPVKKVGSTVTVGAGSLSATTSLGCSNGSVRNALYIEITKGSPNFTFDFCYPLSAAGAVVDMSSSDFLLGMETPVASIPSLTPFSGSYQARTAVTIAVDESVDGYLDGCFLGFSWGIWWAEIWDFAVFRVS